MELTISSLRRCQVLGVAFCYEVTDMGLAALSGMPLLQELDVTGCCSVTAAACDVLQHTSNVHVTVRWSRERTAAEEAKNSFSFALIPLV